MIKATEIPTKYSRLLLEERIDAVARLARLLRGALSEEGIFTNEEDAEVFSHFATELEDHAMHARGIFGLPHE